MKKIYLLLAIVLFATISFAQDAKKDDWIRIQSDDGEFSIEVPAKYGYFYDKDGVSVGDFNERYSLNEMSVFNSYTEHTLLSFESYRANPKALEILEHQNENPANSKTSSVEWTEAQGKDYKIRQLIFKDEKQFTVKRYFSSKNYIYLLVASSRSSATPVMKRFLDSLIFKPNPSETPKNLKSERFTTLKSTKIEYEAKPKKQKKEKTILLSKPVESNPSVKPLVIISQERASYNQEALKNNEQGIVSLRLEFSEFGQITKISEIKTLDYGLVRMAVLAVMRMKFLSEEKDDIPASTTRTVEYSFKLY
jgi:Gram-negative bacterial TonB protein C-terminal